MVCVKTFITEVSKESNVSLDKIDYKDGWNERGNRRITVIIKSDERDVEAVTKAMTKLVPKDCRTIILYAGKNKRVLYFNLH